MADTSKQIGCGYCANETTCPKRDPKINKAKAGCEDYLHHEQAKQKPKQPLNKK